MIQKADVRVVKVTPLEFITVKAAAAAWDYPGRSSIRNMEERKATLDQDALVGMCGQFASLKYLFGPGALERFAISRWHADKHPFDSDDGHDIDGLSLDVKSSLRRDPGRCPLAYNLCVRPKERRAGWTYIMAMVDLAEDRARVHLVGWASTDMLPVQPTDSGPLAGAFVLPGRSLRSLPPLEWSYFGRAAA